MSERDVEVNLADGMAALRGERKDERDVEEDGYIVREQTHGRFERIIPLPDGLEPKEAKATFNNGELKLTIPKTTEARRKVKRIPVKGGG